MINKKNAKLISQLNKSFKFLVNNPYSSFYKDKYKKAGVKLKSIKTLEDFKSLPYLTKDEILSVSPYDFLFIPHEKADHVAVTSGTTSQNNPLMLITNIKARPKWHDYEKWKLFIDAKVTAHLLLYSGTTSAHRIRTNYGLTNKGIINVIGDLGNMPLTAKLAKRIGIESIESSSSILYHFIPYLKKEYDLNKIKVILLGTEYTSEQKYKYLQKAFKKAKFVFDLGSVETGAIALGCEYLSKKGARFMHPVNFVYLETANNSEEGEMIVTGIEAGKLPYLIRYKTNLNVRLTDFDCKCGEKKLIEVFGRIGHDVLTIQGTHIYTSQVYKTLSGLLQYLQTDDFRLHVYEQNINNKIIIKLVLQLIPKKGQDQTKIKKEIRKYIENNLFLTATHTLGDLIKKNVYMPLKVEFKEEFSLKTKQINIVSHIV